MFINIQHKQCPSKQFNEKKFGFPKAMKIRISNISAKSVMKVNKLSH